MTNKEIAYEKIRELVEKFEEYKNTYKSATYNETQVRNEFINPFWEALGWDIYNKENCPPSRFQVIHEATIKQRKGSKKERVDYKFQRETNKTFFVLEAKKPFVNVFEDKYPAFQLKKYGWNERLKISVLTDFEEFAIYNCTKQPKKIHEANKNRIKYFTFLQYLSEFDFLWQLFAKENVFGGSIDNFVKDKKEFESKETVDLIFLATIETWRTALANNLILRNKNLDEYELNYTIQQIINRILFLKIAEDREIEPENQLKNTIKTGIYYQNIFKLFENADKRYNSGLFNFKKDETARQLKVDNKTIKIIIDNLYDEESFDFSLIPVEILGFIYEQFLGSEINIKDNKQIEVEQKMEVRKAGGVYYTPIEVVEYMIKNTIGKKIEHKKPNEISDIKIIDPSCGSGSFLLGAYQYLLTFHLDYYIDLKNKGENVPELTPENNLTTQTKKEILINNIFGVDIDMQAVEVSKLSLLIKCLEGETSATIENIIQNDKSKVLPSLENNILCGNSLISSDFDGVFMSKKEERKINIFDWEIGFSSIFKKNKGFDVVIGNPPYGADLQQNDYIKQKFPYSSQMKEINSYLYFTEFSLRLMKDDAIFGYIIPDTFVMKTQYLSFRKFLFEKTNIYEIIETGSVFKQAKATPNILLFFEKNNKIRNGNLSHTFLRKQLNIHQNIDTILQDLRTKKFETEGTMSYQYWKKSFEFQLGRYVENKKLEIINKMIDNPKNIPLITFNNIEIDRGLEGGKSNLLEKSRKKNVKKILIPDNIDKYFINKNKTYITEETKQSFDFDRILVIRIRNTKIKERIIACLETEKRATLKTIQQIFFKGTSKIDLKYILAILNSELMNFYCHHFLSDDINKDYLSKLPIPEIDLKDEKSKQIYENIVKKVDEIMLLKNDLSISKIQVDKDRLQRRITHAENQINELVFDLYALTSEEKEIILGE